MIFIQTLTILDPLKLKWNRKEENSWLFITQTVHTGDDGSQWFVVRGHRVKRLGNAALCRHTLIIIILTSQSRNMNISWRWWSSVLLSSIIWWSSKHWLLIRASRLHRRQIKSFVRRLQLPEDVSLKEAVDINRSCGC